MVASGLKAHESQNKRSSLQPSDSQCEPLNTFASLTGAQFPQPLLQPIPKPSPHCLHFNAATNRNSASCTRVADFCFLFLLQLSY